MGRRDGRASAHCGRPAPREGAACGSTRLTRRPSGRARVVVLGGAVD